MQTFYKLHIYILCYILHIQLYTTQNLSLLFQMYLPSEMTVNYCCVYLYFLNWQVWTDNKLFLRVWKVLLINQRKKNQFLLVGSILAFIPMPWSWMLQECICNHLQGGHCTFIKSETAPLQSAKTRDPMNTWNCNFQISFSS